MTLYPSLQRNAVTSITPIAIRTYRQLLRVISKFPLVHLRAYFASMARETFEAHRFLASETRAQELIEDAKLDIAFIARLVQITRQDPDILNVITQISHFHDSPKMLHTLHQLKETIHEKQLPISDRKCKWLPTTNMDIQF